MDIFLLLLFFDSLGCGIFPIQALLCFLPPVSWLSSCSLAPFILQMFVHISDSQYPSHCAAVFFSLCRKPAQFLSLWPYPCGEDKKTVSGAFAVTAFARSHFEFTPPSFTGNPNFCNHPLSIESFCSWLLNSTVLNVFLTGTRSECALNHLVLCSTGSYQIICVELYQSLTMGELTCLCGILFELFQLSSTLSLVVFGQFWHYFGNP